MELVQAHVLWADIADSLRRVAIGFGLAAVLGIPLGLALGWYPELNKVVNPVIQLLRPISPIAWIPVAILFLGIGDRSATALIFLGAFFPIVVSCVDGVNNVSSVFRRAGRNFGLSPLQLLGRVVFPAALPNILVGLRIAFGIAWLVVVAAEMVAVDSGLGYPHHRLAKFRQALRSGGRCHAAHRHHRACTRLSFPRSGADQVRSLGLSS